MKIANLTIDANFRYLWLKTVRDVDLTQHCARSLVGEYDKRISPAQRVIHDLDLQDSVYYLCGVAFPLLEQELPPRIYAVPREVHPLRKQRNHR